MTSEEIITQKRQHDLKIDQNYKIDLKLFLKIPKLILVVVFFFERKNHNLYNSGNSDEHYSSKVYIHMLNFWLDSEELSNSKSSHSLNSMI